MITEFQIFENNSYYFTEEEENFLIQNGFKIVRDEASKTENGLRITILKVHLATVATYFQYHISKIEGFTAKTYGEGSNSSLDKVIEEIEKIKNKHRQIYHGRPKRPLDWDYSKKNAWDTYFSFKEIEK